jgi:ABC-type polysaccharide/polyol phosphate export permease
MTFSEGKPTQYSTSLFRSFQIQLRVIGALLMREILTRYGRHNIGFLWVFVEPMIFTLGITVLWSYFKMTHGSNLPITAFAVTGYSSILLWRNMPARCCLAIQPNLALMYHRNVKVFDIFASRLLLEIAGATTSFITLTLFFVSIGMMKLPEDVLKVILGWLLLAWFGASLALAVGSLSELYDVVEKLWHPFAYLLVPLSGAAFMVEWLPPYVKKYAVYVPMVQGVEIVREGYFGSTVRSHYDLSYMVVFCLCQTFIGIFISRVVGRRVVPE